MGCWNGTCGISQLPITAGAKVKTFLMLQSEFSDSICGSGVCYATAYFRPWFLPVNAKYNDYGSIENIQSDWNSTYMLETFQNWLKEGKVKLLAGDAEINDPGIRKFKTLDDVFDCVERGALLYSCNFPKFDHKQKKYVPNKSFLKIGMFMVLENIYDGLLQESVRFLGLPENKYYAERKDEDFQKALVTINKFRSPKTKTDLDELIGSVYVDRLLGDLSEESWAFKHYKTLLFHPTKVKVDEFFAKLDEARNIGTSMTYLRKLWIPQTGQGSQSEELSFNTALSQSTLKHISAREIEYET